MNLRIVPTKAHAAVDMATGPALIAAPTLLRMNGNTGATIPPRVVGSLATAYSLLLPLKHSVTPIDALVLVGIFVAYTIRISRLTRSAVSRSPRRRS